MANINGAFGLRPIAKVGSNTNSTGVTGYTQYEIASGNTNALYHGQPVIPLSTGYIDLTGDAAGGTVRLLGAFMGCEYVSSTTGKPTWSNYWPGNAATDAVAFLFDHPMDVFLVQADAAFPVADLWGNFDIVDNSGTGSSDSGISYMELDVTTGATTATLPMKALDISEDPENSDVSTANTNVLVTIQNHLFGAKQVGLA